MIAFLYDFELMACISFLIPLIPGWIRFWKLSGELKFFIVILSIVFAFYTIGHFTGLYGIYNLSLYSTMYIVQFYLYSVLFRKLLRSKSSKWLINLLIILFTGYLLFSFKKVYSARSYDSITPAFLSIVMILYCLLFFNRQLKNVQANFIYKSSWFWIISGLLLYFAGSFIIFLVTNYLMERNNNLTRNLWVLLQLFDIGKNILLGMGFFFINTKGWSKSF